MDTQPTLPIISPKMKALLRKHERLAAAKLDIEGHRMCTKCGNVKPHSHMKKDKNRKFGIQRICKNCDNVVWPKHARRRAAKQAIELRTINANAPDTGIPDDVRRKAELVAGAVETYFKPVGVPQGLMPHPDKSLRTLPMLMRHLGPIDTQFIDHATKLLNDIAPHPLPLPASEPTREQTEDVGWWNDFFRKNRSTSKRVDDADLPDGLRPADPEDAMKPSPPDQTALKFADFAAEKAWADSMMDAVDARNPCKDIKLTDSYEQAALRAKMTRDGFSAKMIEGAVRLLPTILKELKEIDNG